MLTACGGQPAGEVVRIGHFPNITHAHALVAHALSRRGEGIFEKHLGVDVAVEWYVYNAGPSAMESLLAGALDVTYVGPNPAINAHTKTRGDDVRILAGATNGGAALVVRQDAGVRTAEDLRGRRIATPQFGNTQDVSCRAWLQAQGFTVTQTGGDVLVVPTANPDQLALFQQGELDAAWTVEPWVSRLEAEGGGVLFLQEEGAITTVLASSVGFLAQHQERARQVLAAHRELTQWIAAHPQQAQELVALELRELTGRPFPATLVTHCWPRLSFVDSVATKDLQSFVDKAAAVGFVTGFSDLSRLVQTP